MDRIIVHVGDANDLKALAAISEICDGFDIIIDDGSHESGDIIRAFSNYFPLLAHGGLYIVEDLHCSYWQEYNGGLENPASSLSFFRRLTDFLNKESWGGALRNTELLSFFMDRYDVQFSDEHLDEIYRIMFQNSLVAIWKDAPQKALLGPRIVAGSVALVTEDVVGMGGAAISAPPQPNNPFGPKAMRREAAAFKYASSQVPADFDPLEYLELHADVKKAGVDPRQHYLEFGIREGRIYKKSSR